jgi:glutamyl-tRNA reductase
VSVVVIGLNHRTVPLDVLEHLTVPDERLPKVLTDLRSRAYVGEAVVLSTCNRTEVYATVERFHGAYHEIRDVLSALSHLPHEAFGDHLYAYYDHEAVEHLFRVSAGLDSAVLGEVEILGQVRTAWERAQAEGATGSSLNLLFRHAIEAGKRARTETSISRHTTSLSQAAVGLATERLGDGCSLSGASVAVLGAGDMGEGLIRSLVAAGATDVVVANRTHERAVELARSVDGRAVGLSELATVLGEVDLLLTSTGSPALLLDATDVEAAMDVRDHRPLLLIDLAVPRDIDPAAGDVDGVTLLDMDDLRAFAEVGLAGRRREVTAVEELIAEELDRFTAVASAREVAPLVAALHARADDIRRAELDRFRSRLSTLDDDQREAVEALTRAMLAKVLHDPTVGLKGAAGSPRGERLADAVRHLFGL